MFQFENFRVRKLAAINALNFYITLCMAFLAHMSMKSETHALKAAIIQKADPIKEKVQFSYYRLAKGISGILSYAKEGIRLWFLKLDELEQDYVIRLTVKRKLFFHGKWIPATQLHNQRKGKIKTSGISSTLP